MKTSLIAFGVALLLLSVGALSIFQGNIIQQHKKILAAKNLEIAELNLTLDEEEVKIDQLTLLNHTYEDSILVLNEKIAVLELALDEKNKTIKYLEGKLKRREISYQDLKDKIAKLYRKEQLDKKAIARLEKEKEALRKEMSLIQVNTNEIFAAKSATEAEIKDYKENISSMALLTDIAENTNVFFNEISGRKFKTGRKISKMRKNMNGWQYTDFKFTLSHPNHQTLLDKQFVLKIFDKENNIPLAYLEQNPMFHSSTQKGIPFQFDGNTIELTYCNMQKKLSENFEVRIYLLLNGEEIALENGVLPIVNNGAFIKV